MEKLPQTSHRRRKSDFDVSQISLAAITDRKIKNIIETRKTESFFEPKHVRMPQEKIRLSDSAEVSSQLSTLMTVMDKERFTFTSGDRRLNGLKTESVKIEEVIIKRKSILSDLKTKLDETKIAILQVIDLQQNEDANSIIYSHVLDRMRTTLVFLKKKFVESEKLLHLNSFHLTQNLQKSVKTKEKKHDKLQVLSIVKQNADFEKTLKNKEVHKMTKDLKKRKEMSAKRLEHKLKQEKMTEQCVIEDQSAQMKGTREKYLVHFMWQMLSAQRFQKEQVKWKRFEEAFLKIKLVTGVQDISLLVEKYLTKEQIYSDFVHSVKNKECELEEYKEKIEKMQESINKLVQSDEFEGLGVDKEKFVQVEGIRKEVLEQNKKFKYLRIVHNKIKDWCFRYCDKIDVVCGEQLKVDRTKMEDKGLRECFGMISGRILRVIRGMKGKNGLGKEVMKKRQSMSGVIEKIPLRNRIKVGLSDNFELSELVYIEMIDENAKKYK